MLKVPFRARAHALASSYITHARPREEPPPIHLTADCIIAMVYKYHSDSSAVHSMKSMLLQSIPVLAAFFLIAPGLVVHAQQDEVLSTQCAASTLAGYDFQVWVKSRV